MLADVIRHVGGCKDRSLPELQEHLAECALAVMRHYSDFLKIVALETFMPLVDLIQAPAQVSVHKELLRLFNKHPTAPGAQDPMVLHTAFALAKSAHDAIDSMSSDEDRREAGELLMCALLSKLVGCFTSC